MTREEILNHARLLAQITMSNLASLAQHLELLGRAEDGMHMRNMQVAAAKLAQELASEHSKDYTS